MTDNLTIESCVELLKQHGGSVHGPNVETVSVPLENFLAYSQALEARIAAPLQQQILMDTECIERIRDKAAALEVDAAKRGEEHEAFRKWAEGTVMSNLQLIDKMAEELAGLQAIIAKKDVELDRLAMDVSPELWSNEYRQRFDKVRNLASPAAALEAVRAEDRAEIERLFAKVSEYRAFAWGITTYRGKLVDGSALADIAQAIMDDKEFTTHPKE